jgi:hypothetical protein
MSGLSSLVMHQEAEAEAEAVELQIKSVHDNANELAAITRESIKPIVSIFRLVHESCLA